MRGWWVLVGLLLLIAPATARAAEWGVVEAEPTKVDEEAVRQLAAALYPRVRRGLLGATAGMRAGMGGLLGGYHLALSARVRQDVSGTVFADVREPLRWAHLGIGLGSAIQIFPEAMSLLSIAISPDRGLWRVERSSNLMRLGFDVGVSAASWASLAALDSHRRNQGLEYDALHRESALYLGVTGGVTAALIALDIAGLALANKGRRAESAMVLPVAVPGGLAVVGRF
jgi:hypothetical protein